MLCSCYNLKYLEVEFHKTFERYFKISCIAMLCIWLTVWAPSMQWAAVITWFSLIIEPPQKCRPRLFNVTCHGNSSVTIWKAAIWNVFWNSYPWPRFWPSLALKWNFNFFWEFQLESYSFCQIAKMSVNQNASSYDFFLQFQRN